MFAIASRVDQTQHLLAHKRAVLVAAQFVRYAEIVATAVQAAAAALPDPAPSVMWVPDAECEHLPFAVFDDSSKLRWKLDAATNRAILCHAGLSAVSDPQTADAVELLIKEDLADALARHGVVATLVREDSLSIAFESA